MILKNHKKIISLFLCVFIFFSLFISLKKSSAVSNVNSVSEAPLSDEFLEYQKYLNSGDINALQKYAIIPFPTESTPQKKISLLSDSANQAKSVTFPSSYDLRKYGKTSSVKEQMISGPCWTFATMSSLESNLLPGEKLDFSENNLKNTHGFDLTVSDGGNGKMSTAYFARWSGPVLESLDPYSSTSSVSPSNLNPAKHVQEVLYLPKTVDPLNTNEYKDVISNHGAIMAYMFWEDGKSCYNDKTYAYYYKGIDNFNHAITVVGWDDNYSSSNFSIAPPGNGAWLVENSFGTDFGDNGYFYISYYDSVLFKTTESYCFINAEDTNNYSAIYQYDPLGVITQIGFTLTPTVGWMANVFTAQNDDGIKAVSFYTPEENCSYEVYIYKQWDGINFNGLLTSCSGSIVYAGYHTITLPAIAPVENGKTFGVVVKIITNNNGWPISLETKLRGYSSGASAQPGQSYYSSDGKTWRDVTAQYPDGNACVKAFSSNENNSNLGNVNVNTYLDEKAWSGDILYYITGNTNISGTTAPANYSIPTGIYNFVYVGGGPANSHMTKIEPATNFNITNNGTYTINLYFSTFPAEYYYADLIVDNTRIEPAVPKIGENVTLYFDILNIGRGNVLDNYAFTITLDDKVISTIVDSNKMPAKTSKGWKFDFKWPEDIEMHSIVIILDEPNNVIREANENNNQQSLFAEGITNELSKSSPTIVSIDSTSSKYYIYKSTSEDDILKFSFLIKEKADIKIYLRKGSLPTEFNFDKKISLMDSNHSITVSTASNDRWYILIKPENSEIGKSFSINIISGANIKYKLNCSIVPWNAGIINRNVNNTEYSNGTSVILMAVPQTGYMFDSWGGDINSKETSITILMNSDKNIIANFKIAPALTLTTPKLNTIEIPEDRTIKITWNPVTDIDKVDLYVVYRKTSQDKDFSIVAIAGKNSNLYTDKDVKYGETYSYYITTKNNSKDIDSKPSNILSIPVSTKNHIIKLILGSKIMYVGDFKENLEVAPISINGRTMLPIRPILEAVDGKIDWDEKEKKITILRGDTTILLWIGKNYGITNGKKVKIDSTNPKVVPIILRERTLLPVRFISEQLGANISWKDSTKEITLNF